MIEEIIAVFFGVFLGILTGLLPGMSINNFLPIFLTLTIFSQEVLVVFIVSFAVSQLIAQFIPSIFLGAPSEITSISVLPGHKLLLEGKGYEAVKICLISCILSMFFSFLIIFTIHQNFKEFYHKIRDYIFYPILFIVIFTILAENGLKKIIMSLFIFLISGLVGFITLNSPYPSSNLMFPLLAGFFGLSTLLVSLKEKSYIPEQNLSEQINIKKIDLVKSSLIGTLSGLLVGFLPGVGVSQAAVLAQSLFGLYDPRFFLSTISSINLSNEIFSLNSLYLVGNPRSGTSVALQKILDEFNFSTFLLLFPTILISVGLSIPILLHISKKFTKFVEKINYIFLNVGIICFLSILTLIFTGIFGMIIFITCGAIGVLAVELKIKRSHCMGCLLLPTLLFFSGKNVLFLNILFG